MFIPDNTFGQAGDLNLPFMRIDGKEIGNPFGPLDHGYPIRMGQIFLDAKIKRLPLAGNAIEVDVVDRQAASDVLVDQREGGTGHVAAIAKPAREALDQLRLARAEHAAERENLAAFQVSRPAFPEGLCGLDAV